MIACIVIKSHILAIDAPSRTDFLERQHYINDKPEALSYSTLKIEVLEKKNGK